ncbi:PIN domain-containing protein [Allofrancisella guangzhouensis]|uniref:PIN domain-containing protein n=1 Tax=Allofrancisella inopinata TaxID=1085647 RepID=A0AAE6YJ85_9GAMM|nr:MULTISPECIES: PIN domain-containing protein [Allofrancisella]MBK2027380.1 PIN domain-containing protein [Allofrancisella guangzhouensis]MBK2043435.1 PIN domain-containing protein [Allofrancisella guangzhouensis]MBK2045204.1 PIN domain-containing protein [Allofrancisella guangzhouensis]QIV96472.1 PIN domain-containing protein [Allofrancisella inopinata]TDT68682.1 PIN domain nuclease of toxin-antitoxin system [Allofrancisella inopinata]
MLRKPIILDTCAIAYLFLSDELDTKHQVSDGLLSYIENHGAVILSISFAELECLTRKSYNSLSSLDVNELYSELSKIFEIVDIDTDLWLEAVRLEWDHKDPADRLIVAYAKYYNYPIATSDLKIKSYYSNTII